MTIQTIEIAKHRFVESLEIDQTLKELAENIAYSQMVVSELNEARRLANQARQQAEEIKALTLISGEIDGKNEQIRNAQLVQALKSNATYQEVMRQETAAEDKIARLEAELSRCRDVASMLKIKARLAAATLEYLAD